MVRSLLVSVATFALLGCSQSQPQNLLWVGKRQVDVMGLVSSERFKEMTEKLTRALDANPEWREEVQSVPSGQPLTFDPRCGLTEEEFDEYLELSKSLSVGKASEGTLTINSKGDRVYSLIGDDTLSLLTGTEIDLRNNVVRTQYGVADQCTMINANEESILGPWTGTKWTLEIPPTETVQKLTVTFAVGRLMNSHRGVMYYRVNEGSRAGNTRVIQIVTFDVP